MWVARISDTRHGRKGGGPEKGANQEIIQPQREGRDETLVAKEQHAALDPNRLRRKSCLCYLGDRWKTHMRRGKEGYMITHLQQPPL